MQMSSNIFLTTYHPLIVRGTGRTAAQDYNLPPFVDASCRREPDFEHPFPSISAICHAAGFAPRLHIGDTVVYLTVKRSYLGIKPAHWRLTSILRVIERFEKHREAADWYESQGLWLPSNCLVRGNPPLPLEKTIGYHKGEDKKLIKATKVERWDSGYWKRSRQYGTFLACEDLFTELWQPPILHNVDAEAIFDQGQMPGTQTPPKISNTEFERLKHICGIP